MSGDSFWCEPEGQVWGMVCMAQSSMTFLLWEFKTEQKGGRGFQCTRGPSHAAHAMPCFHPLPFQRRGQTLNSLSPSLLGVPVLGWWSCET